MKRAVRNELVSIVAGVLWDIGKRVAQRVRRRIAKRKARKEHPDAEQKQ